MKFAVAILAALASSASAFASPAFVSSATAAVSRSAVVLEASRNRDKIASRTQWAESRGLGAGVAEAASIQGGLMKNEQGLEYVKLVHPSGSSSEIYLYGGVVTSYIDAEGVEYIAVRPDAKMDGSKPISGGLSHCWPQVCYRYARRGKI